ncbi:hypothetical protein AG1IA_07038 [Rhizoctonia solani AG-1 IA]|uniref:Uncharacterized protein n=1 Tax=Thanatephorus cucumeris (strain AG1-IA) TaxID=983506 RepID=L8WL88_THACA|nr:hypothetical protein AG1IA_07038 [Rhizoctonia solani AG-1 IA]
MKAVCLSENFFSTHHSAVNRLTTRQNIPDLFQLLLDLIPFFSAFLKQILPVLLAIIAPAIINLVLKDNFHGLMTNLTSEIASHSLASDSALRNAASQDVMAYLCPFLADHLRPETVKRLEVPDPDISKLLIALSNATQLNPTELVPKSEYVIQNETVVSLTCLSASVGAMNNLTLCFPKTAKLFTSGAMHRAAVCVNCLAWKLPIVAGPHQSSGLGIFFYLITAAQSHRMVTRVGTTNVRPLLGAGYLLRVLSSRPDNQSHSNVNAGSEPYGVEEECIECSLNAVAASYTPATGSGDDLSSATAFRFYLSRSPTAVDSRTHPAWQLTCVRHRSPLLSISKDVENTCVADTEGAYNECKVDDPVSLMSM